MKILKSYLTMMAIVLVFVGSPPSYAGDDTNQSETKCSCQTRCRAFLHLFRHKCSEKCRHSVVSRTIVTKTVPGDVVETRYVKGPTVYVEGEKPCPPTKTTRVVEVPGDVVETRYVKGPTVYVEDQRHCFDESTSFWRNTSFFMVTDWEVSRLPVEPVCDREPIPGVRP